MDACHCGGFNTRDCLSNLLKRIASDCKNFLSSREFI